MNLYLELTENKLQQIDQRKKDMDRMDKKHEALIKDINGVYDALRNYMAKETENKVFSISTIS